MTNADAGDAPRSGLLLWAEHNATYLIIAVLGLDFLASVMSGSTGGGGGSWFFFAAMTAGTVLINRHGRSLCERCAADLPLDPDAVVERRHNRLVMVHKFMGWRATVIIVGLSFISIIASSNPVLSISLWFAQTAFLAYLLLSVDTHSKLTPWCPFCRGGGGGEDESVETPDPVPSNTRQLS